MSGSGSGPSPRAPLYARALRLRSLRPSGVLCFLYFEGAIALGILLALAELVNWWVVLLLPAAVAAMVKLNDLLAQAVPRPGQAVPGTSAGLEGAAEVGPEAEGSRSAAATRFVVRTGPGNEGPGAVREAVPAAGARQVSRDVAEALDPVDSVRQRVRQSARWRYQE